MISAYTAELIRTIVDSKIISQTEMTSLLNMTPEEMAKTLEGSNAQITLHNLECLTSFFGIQVFDCKFLDGLVGVGNYRGDGHKNIVSKNSNIANKISKTYAYFGGRDYSLASRLGRIGSTQGFVESCDLMVEALKDYGIIGVDSTQNEC